jgi:hypothetical protein
LELALYLLDNLYLLEFANAHLHLPHLLLVLSVLQLSQMEHNVTNMQHMTTTDVISITLYLFAKSRMRSSKELCAKSATSTTSSCTTPL